MTQKQFERFTAGAVLLMVLAFGAVRAQASGTVVVTPFYNGKPQFLDNNGVICSGCKLYTYSAGTTTPLATYPSFANGGTTNANPVVLDSSGRADIWMSGNNYKFALKTAADVTIWTVDNVPSPLIYTTLNSVTIVSTAPGFGLSVTNTANNGLQVVSSDFAADLRTSGNASTSLNINNTGTGATTGAVVATAGTSSLTASFENTGAVAGTVLKLKGTGSGGGTPVLISALNNGGVEKFSVANTGAIAGFSLAINGGTPITAQTGTGGTVVMSVSPALTGTTTAAAITASGTVTAGVLAMTLLTTVATNTTAIGAGACAALQTSAFSGALSTDVILANPNADLPAQWQKGLVATWFATANNVNVRVCNPTAGSITPDALTWNIRIIH